MQSLFKFITSDGTLVTASFSLTPLTFPVCNGAQVIEGDPITISGSPAVVSIISNIYDVGLNAYSTNDWFISGSSNTASLNLISGSYVTGSLSKVLFDFANSTQSIDASRGVIVRRSEER